MDPNQQWNWQQSQGGYPMPMPNPNPFFGMPMPFNFNPNQTQTPSQRPFSQPYQPQWQDGGASWSERTFGSPAFRDRPQNGPYRHQDDGRDRNQGFFGRPPSGNNFQHNQPRSQNDGRRQDEEDSYRPGPQQRQQNYGRRHDEGDSYWSAPQQRGQNDGRRHGEGDSYRPGSQFSTTGQGRQQNEGGGWGDPEFRNRQRRERQRGNASQGNGPRQRRAVAPTWTFPEDRPLPFPMDNPAAGPFGSTRPLRQNNAVNTRGDNSNASLPTRPLRQNQPTQIPGGLGAIGGNPAPKGIKRKSKSKSKATKNPGGGPNPAPNTTNTTTTVANTSNRRHRNPPQPTAPEPRDAISAPSAASGGIPNPTPTYLHRAAFTPFTLPTPKPLLVVIDLNGTLLFRPHRRNPFNFIQRPLARAFLERCITQHHVVIWSSARPENVQRMCAQLLSPALLARVIAVWGRDRFGLSQDDYNRRTQCYKRLTRLWEDPVVGLSHPQAAVGGVWNQANTVLIDDSVEKARSEPHNAVTLPEFAGDLNEKPQVLPLVEEYLDALARQMDISTYIRTRPFTMEQGRQAAAIEEQA